MTAVAAARRIGSLALAEAILLRRNPTALVIGLGVPISWTLLLRNSSPTHTGSSAAAAASSLTSLAALAVLSLVFFNLVTTLVARREELMLKRLRTGELTDGEILIGSSLPGVALAWAQILVGLVAALTVFGLPRPTNPGLVLLAITLGTLVFGLLAAVCTVVTRSVELAQLTTAPVLVVSAAIGLVFPVTDLPARWQPIGRLLPMTRFVDLMHLGIGGTTPSGSTVGLAGSFGAAVSPLLVLVVWLAVAGWATRRWFRWEPRH